MSTINRFVFARVLFNLPLLEQSYILQMIDEIFKGFGPVGVFQV